MRLFRTCFQQQQRCIVFSEIGYDLSNLNDKCLDFLDTLWSADGAVLWQLG
jgi:hypothetical protein